MCDPSEALDDARIGRPEGGPETVLVPFSRTLRALAPDRGHQLLAWVGGALVLVGAWLAWFVLARVAVYETSERARIEVGRSGYTIESPVSGRIAMSGLVLDRLVREGDVVVELDATLVTQRLAEATGRFEALRPRREARSIEIAAEESQRARITEQAEKAIQAARAKHEQAIAAAVLARDEAARVERLQRSGAVPEIDLVRAQADAKQKELAVEGARLEVGRLERQREADLGEIQVRISRARSELVDLEGQIASSKAAVAALNEEREQHVLRAPTTGRVAELASKQPGSFVQPGERLATIVPEGNLHAVAQFVPARAVGRIKPGQPVRLRLDGYPWMQFGSLPGRVERVGTEMREGLIRVEISVSPDPSSRIPVQHGLSGQAEVAVEQISPFELLLRASGGVLTSSGDKK